MAESERYEFDAPSHVVDFQELDKAVNDDTWFEQQAVEGEGNLCTPMRSNLPSAPNPPKAIVAPQVNTDVDTDSRKDPSPPPNLVTSWGTGKTSQADAKPKRRTVNQSPVQPRRVSKRKGMTSSSAPAPSAAPPTKKHKMPPSSEEQELERIKNLQREVALHRKKNEASYMAALAGEAPPPKMTLSVTVPEEFHFNTDTRVKATTSSNKTHKEVDFVSQLRKPSSPAKAKRGATVPKPFNLSRGNRRTMAAAGAYVPMAQQIQAFEKQVPDRYHLRSRQSQERGPSPVKADHLKLTRPHSPFLMTRKRTRPPTAKSSADLEAEELDKLQKFKVKALELNRKILERPEDLKKPAVKEPTVPEGFELQIEKRLQERDHSKKPQQGEEKGHSFKAHPLPKKILEGIVGLPDRKVLHPTVPESPAFALKKRVRVSRQVEQVKPPSPVKCPPVPHFGLPFQPQLPNHHNVEVCPFSFEEREKERRALKEKRLEEKQNEEVPQFKAQPLPDFDTVVLPEKKKLEPTKPEPFRLLLDERGAVRTNRWEQMVKEEQKKQSEAAHFKARPNTVTHKEPFQPKKEERAPLVVESFELSTERRAHERQMFEQHASEVEALKAMVEEKKRCEEEQRQMEEIAKLRQEQVHKAQPIRHYRPVEVKKSEIPLTVPQSPNFSDRFRL